MIVILCPSFEDAIHAYDIFVSFLEDINPWAIKKTYNASYCVETDDDLRYIFTDYRLRNVFHTPDKIDMEQFFEDISEYG